MEIYQTKDEQDVLKCELQLVKKMMDKGELKGELAEVGVMWGGSAKIIRDEIPDIPLYLFDTFLGLPDMIIKGVDPEHYREGDMQVDIERVKYYFKDYKNTFIYEGIFPKDTSKFIEDKKFVFAHIDTDIYQSTRDSLLFFWPRLEINGSIVIHDYPAHSGVKKAVDELFDGVGTRRLSKWRTWKLNPMIESGNRQLIIRKRFDHSLNLKVSPPPKYPQVYLEDEEVLDLIKNGKS